MGTPKDMGTPTPAGPAQAPDPPAEHPLQQRLADFQGELERDGRAPATRQRYGTAIRELDAAVEAVSSDAAPGASAAAIDRLALARYLADLSHRSLKPSTVASKLGYVGSFARWLVEHEPDLVDPAVVPLLADLRRAVASGSLVVTSEAFDPAAIVGGHIGARAEPPVPGTEVGADAGAGPGAGADDTGGDEAGGDEAAETGAEAAATEAGGDERGTGTAETADVVRYLHARAPDRMTPGDRIDVLARIARDEGGGSVTTALKPTRIPAAGTDMYLLISAPDFETLSDPYVRVHVPRDTDSEWVTFSLRSSKEGMHDVEIHALNGGTHLGSVVVQVAVARDAGTARTVDTTDLVDERPTVPGEVTLFVHYDPTGTPPVLQYRLFHQGEGNPPVLSLSGLTVDPTAHVERVIAQLGRLAANATPLDPGLRDELIKEYGINLWRSFVPQPLQDAIWAVADGMQRLTIVSGQDPVPWELLYPLAQGRPDRGFLVEWAELVRWPTGPGVRAAPAALGLRDVTYVLPNDAPPEATVEIEHLRLIDPRLHDGTVIATAPQFVDAIGRADFDLMHLACHNNFAPGASAIRIGGQDIETVFLTRAQVLETLRPRHPVVFMNACRSAGQAPVFTTIDGWAQGFIRAGAGAFVGTLWLVRDGPARSFAETFYGHLVGGDPFGTAIRKARQATRDETGDPTWLAYAAYGDPAAILHREVVP